MLLNIGKTTLDAKNDSLVMNTPGNLDPPCDEFTIHYGVRRPSIKTGLQKHFLVTKKPESEITGESHNRRGIDPSYMSSSPVPK
jgi:hypothetical protein